MDEEKIKELETWLTSEEGRQALTKALDRVKKACEELEKARRVTWEQMNTPCTI